MDEEEKRRLRADILADVGAILGEQLAADAWGRVQVEVVRGPDGEPVVAGIDVEEIVGDEARVDEAFGGEGARAVVPTSARAPRHGFLRNLQELRDHPGAAAQSTQEDDSNAISDVSVSPAVRLGL